MKAASLTVFVFLICVFIRQWLYKRNLRRRSLPSGPLGWPILGNVTDIPRDYAWRAYASMAKQHGDIMYLEVFGQPLLVISSFKRAADVLEKRSSTSSDRPRSTMFLELLGLTWNLGVLPYGDAWRRRRKLLHNYFQRNVVQNHYPLQTVATRRMLGDILHQPALFFEHIRKQTGSVILNSTYGHDVKAKDDPLIRIAESAIAAFNKVSKQPFYLVDALPILKHIPLWFPGARFRRLAEESRIAFNRLRNQPFQDVKSQMARNMAAPCLATKYLTQLDSDESGKKFPQDQEEVIRDAAAVSYGAGSDTTVSSILTFILAMVLYPDIQRKAQAEIDSVVGPNQLPDFEHKKNLPYINFVLLETLRWQPVAPLGVVHSTISEEVYDGYRIPAGTIIQPNIWAMLHDEKIYPEPERFNPDRFMKKEGVDSPPDPSAVSFGFGRRICPGRYLAMNTTWIAIVSILSAFNIEKAKDGNGNEIEPEIAYTDGQISYPEPFECQFVPRSDEIVSLIHNQTDATA